VSLPRKAPFELNNETQSEENKNSFFSYDNRNKYEEQMEQ
jgi:hypothetical protein